MHLYITDQPILQPGVIDIMCEDHPQAYVIELSHSGECVCDECGLVVCDRLVSRDKEWRDFEDTTMKTTRSRCGPATDLSEELCTFTAGPGWRRYQFIEQRMHQVKVSERFK